MITIPSDEFLANSIETEDPVAAPLTKTKWIEPEIQEEYQYHINAMLKKFDKKKLLEDCLLAMGKDGMGLTFSQKESIKKVL